MGVATVVLCEGRLRWFFAGVRNRKISLGIHSLRGLCSRGEVSWM
jgi:hypothetical protein